MLNHVVEFHEHLAIGAFLGFLLLFVLLLVKTFLVRLWFAWRRSGDLRRVVEAPKYDVLRAEGIEEDRS